MSGRRCSKCEETKDDSMFCRDRSKKSGLHPWCRDCRRHPETRRNRKYQLSPGGRLKKQARDRRNRLTSKRRHYEREQSWRRRGIALTVPEYERMYASQGGMCKICERHISLWGRPHAGGACVDHDKTTGHVRGLLCSPCNLGIGILGDNLGRLNRVVAYLTLSIEVAA